MIFSNLYLTLFNVYLFSSFLLDPLLAKEKRNDGPVKMDVRFTETLQLVDRRIGGELDLGFWVEVEVVSGGPGGCAEIESRLQPEVKVKKVCGKSQIFVPLSQLNDHGELHWRIYVDRFIEDKVWRTEFRRFQWIKAVANHVTADEIIEKAWLKSCAFDKEHRKMTLIFIDNRKWIILFPKKHVLSNPDFKLPNLHTSQTRLNPDAQAKNEKASDNMANKRSDSMRWVLPPTAFVMSADDFFSVDNTRGSVGLCRYTLSGLRKAPNSAAIECKQTSEYDEVLGYLPLSCVTDI